MRGLRQAALVVAFALGLTGTASAGTISGTVTAEGGGPIQGACAVALDAGLG